MNRVYHKIVPFIFPAVLIFIFFARLFYPQDSLFMIPDFGESDVLHLNLAFKQILSASLKSKSWPLWTPNIAGGFPILAEGQIGTFYLPNLLLFRFLPAVTAYNLNLIISFALAYLGIYLLGRSIKLSKVSSSFAATVFTFSAFLSVHLNHFNLIQAASLLPLLFWSALLLWQKPKLPFVILFAFFLSQQIFTGHFYIVFITLLSILTFLFIYTLINAVNTAHCSVVFTKKGVIYLIFGIILGFLLSAIQLFPTIELMGLSSRAGGLDFTAVTSYPYPPKHLLTFINPYIFGNPADGTYPPFSSDWGIFWENTAYVGLLPLILALGSIFFLKDKLVKIFLFIAFISLLLVFGRYSPLYLIFSFPPFNFFRVPSKFLLLTTFSLAILSAVVFEKLLSRITAIGKSHMHAIASICYKYKLARVSIICIIFILVIADEYRFSYNYPPITPAFFWTQMPETAKFLQDKEGRITAVGAPLVWNDVFLKTGWKDMKPYEYFRNSLFPNYNALFSIPSIDLNTGGLIPKRFSYFTAIGKEVEIDVKTKEATLSAATLNLLSLSGVRFFISPFNIISQPKLKEIYSVYPPSDYKLPTFRIFQNDLSVPRSYLSFQTEKVTTIEQLYRKLSEKDFMKQKKTLVENDNFVLNESGRGEGLVNITSAREAEIIMETQSDKESILVLTDSQYPGWHAYIDGREVNIETVNLIQKGILLPEGAHNVVFSFKSSSFEVGKIITTVTFFITSLMVFLYRLIFPRKASGNNLLSDYP
ncbi:YfhO family protein [Candidatus Gottesmanbacteria bacterium]|nr:YfhO family protein [Candidatus Gottesmanbacteria bacterium]